MVVASRGRVGASGPTALVVEDNPVNMEVARYALTRGGFEVFGADSAERGLALARDLCPDVILMDLSLPEMDGFEALAVILADDLLRGIPVIAVSAHAMEADRARARARGFAGYITKPIDPRAFPDEVRALIQSRPAGGR